YIVAHLYIWWRLVLPLPSPMWQAGTAVIGLLAPTFPINMRVRRRLMREAAKPLLLVGFIWFGFATYLLLGAVASHIAVGFGADVRYAAEAGAAVSALVVVAGLLNVARGAVVKHVRVPLPRLSIRSYTIAHLTAVHIGPLIGREFAEQLVQRVNALEPDLVVITGDLIDGPLSELRPHIEPLRGLRARDG